MILILTGLLVLVHTSMADDKPVKFEQLPEKAKVFVNQYFPGVNILYVSKDDDFFFPDYKVGFENGIKVEFKNDGSFEKAESIAASLPNSLIPQQIKQYVEKNYPGTLFLEYEASAKHYEVKLSNRLELKFNRDFYLVEVDD